MLRTILFLLLTLIALPFAAYNFDQPLAPEHWAGLTQLAWIMLGIGLLCFVVSEWSGNYSQVDKLWSIVPIFYVAYVAAASGFNNRLCLMGILVGLWGIRLTYNFARRGAYVWPPWAGEEDYRWSILRQQAHFQPRWRFTLFNLFFISLYQNALILLFTLPSIVAWQGQETPLNWLDCVAAALFMLFLVLETVADQQQYDFQTEKYRRIKAGEPLDDDYARGFRSSGLWGLARHPNYTCEQAIWLSFYLFGVAATGRWFNWSLAGAILLLLLFQGSADFVEKISSAKYPEYEAYKKRVGKFF